MNCSIELSVAVVKFLSVTPCGRTLTQPSQGHVNTSFWRYNIILAFLFFHCVPLDDYSSSNTLLASATWFHNTMALLDVNNLKWIPKKAVIPSCLVTKKNVYWTESCMAGSCSLYGWRRRCQVYWRRKGVWQHDTPGTVNWEPLCINFPSLLLAGALLG